MTSLKIPDYRPLELMLDPKITKSDCQDFIMVWENFMPRPLCNTIIEYVDQVFDMGSTINMDDHGLVPQQDEEIVFQSEKYYGGQMKRRDANFMLNYHSADYASQINSILKSCAKHYVEQFQVLNQVKLLSTDIKVQKTPPGGGYHLWHYENGDAGHSARELVWMIYLNDMPEGEAETEFLYQRRRIRPTAGTVVFWPAGYTHTHKGNTVLTEDKYILTGWYIKNHG